MPRSGTSCCVGGCKNKREKDSKVSLHAFPKDIALRDRWVHSIKSTGTSVSRGGKWNGPTTCWTSQQVCSEHFTVESFTLRSRLHWKEGLPYTPKLEDRAVPTLFGPQITTYQMQEPVMRAAFRKREVARIISDYSVPAELQNGSSPTCTNADPVMQDNLIISDYSVPAEQQNGSSPTCTNADPVIQDNLVALQVPTRFPNIEQPEDVATTLSDLDTGLRSPENSKQSKKRHAVSKQRKTGATRDKGVQTPAVMMKSKAPAVQTRVKRTQTLTEQQASGTQYNIADCSSEPSSTQPKFPLLSTPLKDTSTGLTFQSPGLNSSFTSVGADDVENDPDYAPNESHISDDDEPDMDRKNPRDARKFLVFEENLLGLFQVCPSCHGSTTASVSQVIGTYVAVTQQCSCSYVRRWESQPMIGSIPAGNILLCASILFSGCNVTKVFRMFSFINIVTMCLNTFWRHQKETLWPAINNVWENCTRTLYTSIRERGGIVTVAGDGRADSPGHCAKYGTYSLVDVDSSKVISLHLVQSNEVKSSYHMELEGLKRSVASLNGEEIRIGEIVTDRHLQIQKWIRENLLSTKHSYDVWHIVKAVKKKLIALAKEKECEVIYKWVKSITNHLYWSATSTDEDDGDMVLSKWKSVSNHVQNFHDGHEGKFDKCVHDALTDRDWLKPGTKACTKLEGIVMNTKLCNDIHKMSTGPQTSKLESFHSVINQFAPKMTVYSFHGQLCRQILAAMHFNENADRSTATTRDGKMKVKTSFPKYKTNDDFSVRAVREDATFNYVDTLLQTTIEMCGKEIPTPALRTPAPPPLTSGKRKPSKEEAVAILTSHCKKSKRVLVEMCGKEIPTPALRTPAPPPLTSGKRKPSKEEAVAILTSHCKKSKRVLVEKF